VNVNTHKNPAMYTKLNAVLINLFILYYLISDLIYIYIIHNESYLVCAIINDK